MDLPVFTASQFQCVINHTLNDLSYLSFHNIRENHLDMETEFMLSYLWQLLINEMYNLIMEHIKAQYYTLANNRPERTNKAFVNREQIFRKLKRKEIIAVLNQTFDTCYGVALSIPQTATEYSQTLTKIAAAELAKRVNASLSQISTFKRETFEVSLQSRNEEINTEIVLDQFQIIVDGLMSVCEPSDGEDNAPFFSSRISKCFVPQSTPETDGFLITQHKTFVSVLFRKLVEHICYRTNSKLVVKDVKRMLAHVKEKTVGQLGNFIPSIVDDLYIIIYDELCEHFGSPEMLHVAMTDEQELFIEAVATLIKHYVNNCPPLHSRKSRKSILKFWDWIQTSAIKLYSRANDFVDNR